MVAINNFMLIFVILVTRSDKLNYTTLSFNLPSQAPLPSPVTKTKTKTKTILHTQKKHVFQSSQTSLRLHCPGAVY